jgi:hypothetical protein
MPRLFLVDLLQELGKRTRWLVGALAENGQIRQVFQMSHQALIRLVTQENGFGTSVLSDVHRLITLICLLK